MNLGWLLLPVMLGVNHARADDTVVIGRALSHRYLEIEPDCPEGYICLDAWYRWRISVDHTVAGPHIRGRVAAVRSQHTSINDHYFRRLRLFVLRPISDLRERYRLKADYYLMEASPAESMYCFERNPSSYGLRPHNVYEWTGKDYKIYCFELNKSQG